MTLPVASRRLENEQEHHFIEHEHGNGTKDEGKVERKGRLLLAQNILLTNPVEDRV